MSQMGQRRRSKRSSPRPQCPQLPPIAGIRLIPNDRRLVPIGDLSRCSKSTLLDDLVGAAGQGQRDGDAKRLGGFEVDE